MGEKKRRNENVSVLTIKFLNCFGLFSNLGFSCVILETFTIFGDETTTNKDLLFLLTNDLKL